jgi:hypothetical protein
MTLTPSTLRLDLKCGKGSISQGEKCHKGATTAVKTADKATKPALTAADKKLRAKQRSENIQIAVGLGVLGVGLGASVIQAKNMRLAYTEKFGGKDRFTEYKDTFGDPDKLLASFKSSNKAVDAGIFGDVRLGTADGKNVVIKRLTERIKFGPDTVDMMESQGIIGPNTVKNMRFGQSHLTDNEVDHARMAGELGFGPKLLAAKSNLMVSDVAEGRPLASQDLGMRYVKRETPQKLMNQPHKILGVAMRARIKGTQLSTTNKQRVLATMAKMHSAGIAHNDLHPGNIFISKKGAQFIDFGTSERGGAAVAAEFVRMMNPPRAGLQQNGGMGYNLKSLDPGGYAQTERAIKQAIGKRIGSVTSTDIRRAAEKNPAVADQLQAVIDAYYSNLTKKRHDAADTMTITPALLRTDAGIKCGASHIARGKKCHNGASPEPALRGPRNYKREIEQHKATMEANNLNAYIENRKLKRPKSGDDAAWDKLNLEWRNSPEAQEYSAAWKRIEKAKADRKNRNAGIALGVGVAAGLTAMALSGRSGGGSKSFKMPGTGPRPRTPGAGPDLSIVPVRVGVGPARVPNRPRLPGRGPAPALAGTKDPVPPALPGLTPKGLLPPGAPRISKTQRLRNNTRAAMRQAERSIARAAQAEVTRAGAVANAMASTGEATGMAAKSAFRGVRLRAEALRRRYEPGYRSPDPIKLPKALPEAPEAVFQVPFSPPRRKAPERVRRATGDSIQQFYAPVVIDPARIRAHR